MPGSSIWRDGRSSGWLIGRSCLGVAAQPRGAGTAGCLLLQAANRYVAARWALRTTGARRSGRIDIADLTLRLCYVGRSKSCHERSPTALPRHIHHTFKITFPSAGPVPPRGYCLHRMVWLALRASQSPRGPWECNLHLWQMVLAVLCLECSLAVLYERV